MVTIVVYNNTNKSPINLTHKKYIHRIFEYLIICNYYCGEDGNPVYHIVKFINDRKQLFYFRLQTYLCLLLFYFLPDYHFTSFILKMSRRGGLVEGKVYVGGLPEDATSEEVSLFNFQSVYRYFVF